MPLEPGNPRAAGILLHTAAKRVLFLKRKDGQGWAFPGGTIEDSETPEQAAKREVLEETGVLGNNPLSEIDTDGSFTTFQQEVEEFAPQLNDEHSEHVWASMDDPPQPLHPGVAATLKKLLARSSTAQDLREVDANGWFEVKNNPISKAGVFQYSGRSIGASADPGQMYNVLLPPEELGSEDAIRSFRLLPWTDDHPSALLGSREMGLVPADEKGIRGVIGEDIHFDNDTLYANVKVFSEALARKIAAGKKELSCGYRCDFIPQEGFYQGKPYQYVQRNIRGNHTALVDKGRRGPDIRVLDAAEHFTFALDIKECPMPDARKDEVEGTVDADTLGFASDAIDAAIKGTQDSFNSLVGELERKGYSKEYATKVAGKVAAEKGMTGHDSTGVNPMAKDSEVKDPEGKDEPKKEVGVSAKASDRKAARDARGRARDSMSAEEEEAADAAECAEDAEEDKEDEKDDSKEARDRRSARDRRAGARDARKGARDRVARDSANDKGKGMDEAAIAALVRKEVSTSTRGMDAAEIVKQAVAAAVPTIRKEEAAKATLYGRLSPVIGAFDHAEMTHTDMAIYGLKKLGLTPAAESADPMTALDCALAMLSQSTGTRVAQDSVAPSGARAALDNYLAA